MNKLRRGFTYYWEAAFLMILILTLFLRFYSLDNFFVFNGEHGRFFLEIKNYVNSGVVPLKGPPTSHPWLSFGPLYYWIMIPVLILFNYNPIGPASVMATVSLVSVILNYIVIKYIFNKKIALTSSLLMAISYSFLGLSRGAMFFGFVVLLFYPFLYFLYKAFSTNKKYIIYTAFTLGLMLNFHLTPIILIPAVIILLIVYRLKFNLKLIAKTFLAFIIPQIPLLIHDLKNDFEMTKNFILWVPYRIVGFIGLYPKNNVNEAVIKSNIDSLKDYFIKSLIGANEKYYVVVLIFALISILYFLSKVWNKRKKLSGEFIISTFLIIGYIGIFIHGDPPDHYYLPIYPIPLIIYSYTLLLIFKKKRALFYFIILLFIYINLKFYFSNNWFIQSTYSKLDDGYVPYNLQEHISKKIIYEANGEAFELKRRGIVDYFDGDFAQNYQYLLWLYGNEPVKVGNQVVNEGKESELRFTIYEDTRDLPQIGEIFWVSNVAVVKEDLKI